MISQVHIKEGFDLQDMNDIQIWADVNLIGSNEEWTFTNTASGVEEKINIGVPNGETVTIDWGDGTTENQTSAGEEFMTFLHTYSTTGNTISISSTGLPSSITYLNILAKVSGVSPNISANVYLTKFFTYYPTELSGTIVMPTGSSSMTKMNVSSNSYSGVIPDMSNHTSLTQFEGSYNSFTSYAGGAIYATTINFSNNLLPESEVDKILQGAVDGGKTDGQIQLQGNAIPSTAGQSNADILTSRGWSVTVDNDIVVPDDNILFEANFANTTLDISNPSGHQIFDGDTINGIYYEFPYGLPGTGLAIGDPGGYANYFNYILGSVSPTDPEEYENYVVTRFDTGLTIPNTSTTTAIYQEFITDAPGSTTRNQYSCKADPAGDIYNSFNQMYIKHTKFIHVNGINHCGADYLLPFEWKQEGDNSGRFGLYIYNACTGTPYWHLKAEEINGGTPGDDFWTRTSDAVVPLDEWFDIEIFFIGSGDPAVGRVQLAVNGVLIFDVEGQTKKAGTDSIPYYSSQGLKVYGVDAWMQSTDIIMAKEPIPGSILRGSGV